MPAGITHYWPDNRIEVMKHLLPILLGLLLFGCSETGQGAALGGLLGGGAGLATGAAVGHPVAGTLIGGGLGAIGGAAVGSALQNRSYGTEGQGHSGCHHHHCGD